MPDSPRRQKMNVLTPQGPRLKDCILVEIVDAKELPSKYNLDDGSLLTLRHVVQEIWRVEGEYDNENNPLYIVKAVGFVHVVPGPDKRPIN